MSVSLNHMHNARVVPRLITDLKRFICFRLKKGRESFTAALMS